MPLAPSSRRVGRAKKQDNKQRKFLYAGAVLVLSFACFSILMRLNKENRSPYQIREMILNSKAWKACVCLSKSQPTIVEACTAAGPSQQSWCHVNETCPGARKRVESEVDVIHSDTSDPESTATDTNAYWKRCTPGEKMARPAVAPSVAVKISSALTQDPFPINIRNELAHEQAKNFRHENEIDYSVIFSRSIQSALSDCEFAIDNALSNDNLRKLYSDVVGRSFDGIKPSIINRLVRERIRSTIENDFKDVRSIKSRVIAASRKVAKADGDSIPVGKLMNTPLERDLDIAKVHDLAEWKGLTPTQIITYVRYMVYRETIVTVETETIVKVNRTGPKGRSSEKDNIIMFVLIGVVSICILWICKGKVEGLYKDWVRKDQSRRKLAQTAKKNALDDNKIKLPPVENVSYQTSLEKPEAENSDTSEVTTTETRRTLRRRRVKRPKETDQSLAAKFDPNALVEDWDETSGAWIMKTRANKAADDLNRTLSKSKADRDTMEQNALKDSQTKSGAISAKKKISDDSLKGKWQRQGKPQSKSSKNESTKSDQNEQARFNQPDRIKTKESSKADISGASKFKTAQNTTNVDHVTGPTQTLKSSATVLSTRSSPVAKKLSQSVTKYTNVKEEHKSNLNSITEFKTSPTQSKKSINAHQTSQPSKKNQGKARPLPASRQTPETTKSATRSDIEKRKENSAPEASTDIRIPTPSDPAKTSNKTNNKTTREKKKTGNGASGVSQVVKSPSGNKSKVPQKNSIPTPMPQVKTGTVASPSIDAVAAKAVSNSSTNEASQSSSPTVEAIAANSVTGSQSSSPRETITQGVGGKPHQSPQTPRKASQQPSIAPNVVQVPQFVTHGYHPSYGVTYSHSHSPGVFDPNVAYVNSGGQMVQPSPGVQYVANADHLVPVMQMYPQPMPFVMNPATGEMVPVQYEMVPQTPYVTTMPDGQSILVSPEQYLHPPVQYAQSIPHPQRQGFVREVPNQKERSPRKTGK